MGAAITLWMGALLLRWHKARGGIERVLLALAVCIGLWHTSNFVLAIHALLGLERERWVATLRLSDTVAVVSITFAYSLLLHVHLHLWARARSRPFTRRERIRVFLCYIPTLFLFRALPHLWSGEYAPMLEKLAQLQLLAWPAVSFVQAFMLWAVYVLIFISVTDLIIAKLSTESSERRFMQTLAGSFLLIAALIVMVYVLGIGRGTILGNYLTTIANLGSLLPTALLAHRIYRHRYLDLVIRESLVVATLAAVILVIYLYGIRVIGSWLTDSFGLRAGVVESLLILALALIAQPLRKWLENRFHKVFEREAMLYRNVVARIGSYAGTFRRLSELFEFVEARTAQDFGLRRMRIVMFDEVEAVGEPNSSSDEERPDEWLKVVLEELNAAGNAVLENSKSLNERSYALAYPLRRNDKLLGTMLVDAPQDALTYDVRSILGVLAAQMAVAIEDHRLIEQNFSLERRLAQEERLAALGQMAATVAHEVKNPLSAIKSIAQVLREDKGLIAYERDLGLIVGETDRLNSSVTQLLTFARRAPESLSSARAEELIQAVAALSLIQARELGIDLKWDVTTNAVLSAPVASALRDALSNLLLNALQASVNPGTITVRALDDDGSLIVTVSDTGSGVAADVRSRIWEPFFTTRQRGTGLGLAIVRKRIEEVGGTSALVESHPGRGTTFELRVPCVP
jgi:signal transduction histidine kinase